MRTLDLIVAGVLILAHLVIRVGFGAGSAAPDLFTLALLILARDLHMAVAAALGLALGLLEDAQGLLAFGAYGVSMTVVGALAARTRDLFVGDSLAFVATYLFLGKWVRDLLHWIAAGSERGAGFVDAVVVQGGLAALYLTLVGLALLFTTGVLRHTGRAR